MSEPKHLKLGYKPRAWQAECHALKQRFTVLVLHRRAGKTELAVMKLLNKALRVPASTAGRLPQYAYVAPYLKQAKIIAWDRLKSYARKIPNATINESELWVQLPHNGVKVFVFGADKPDALRGLGLDGVVVDEVKDVKPEVWYEILEPALADRHGWALFIGTPKGINLFSELYYAANSREDWGTALYTVYETDALDEVEIKRLKDSLPDEVFRREFLCDFSAAGEDQLISIGQAEDAAGRHYREPDYALAPRILGVDVARFGDDKSVIMRRQGLVAYPPLVFAGMDNMDFAARVAAEINLWQPDAVFVDSGAGGGVIDRLRHLGYDIVEVQFGGRASDPVYVNKRTEMWYGIKKWLEKDLGAIPNMTELKQDISTPTYSYNTKGQIALESKDDIKDRIMRSPDLGDALALTFALPVAPRARNAVEAKELNQHHVIHDYDPLGA